MTPDDPDWETEYRDWQEQLHRRYRKELPREFAESENAQAEDSVEGRWQPAPRVTEADATNDTKSLQRKLDRRLFLLLKGKGTADIQRCSTVRDYARSGHAVYTA